MNLNAFEYQVHDLKEHWIRFLNLKNELDGSTISMCENFFEEKVINKDNDKWKRLRMSLNPVPTIYPEAITKTTPSILPSSTPFWKLQTRRIFKEYEISFKNYKWNKFFEINKTALVYLEKCHQCTLQEDQPGFYKIDVNGSSIPRIIESLKINKNLHIQLFF